MNSGRLSEHFREDCKKGRKKGKPKEGYATPWQYPDSNSLFHFITALSQTPLLYACYFSSCIFNILYF